MGAVSVDADVARLADGLAAVGDAAAAEAARLAGDGGVLGPAGLRRPGAHRGRRPGHDGAGAHRHAAVDCSRASATACSTAR